MNYDPQNPAPPPQKSSTRKWLIGGCGCLAVIGIIAAAVIIWMAYAGAGLFADIKKFATTMESAMKAPEVIEAFGTPLEVVGKQTQTKSTENGANVVVISQQLKGPKGEGKLELVMEQKDSLMPRITGVRIITPEGKEIPLKLDAASAPVLESGDPPPADPDPGPAPAPEAVTE